MADGMTFNDALVKLGITDFEERIFNSNSHGELFHLRQYVDLAEQLKEPFWFREWFIKVVEFAKKEWSRPESVFQHIQKILLDQLKTP